MTDDEIIIIDEDGQVEELNILQEEEPLTVQEQD